MKEKTFVILKPDCLEKRLMPEVLKRIQNAGMELVACKMAKLNEEILQEHYAHIVGKPFYPPLVKFMSRRSVVLCVFEGENAIAKIRQLLGPTNSEVASAGTIRGDFGWNSSENIAHASDSPESATAEIARFFKAEEIF